MKAIVLAAMAFFPLMSSAATLCQGAAHNHRFTVIQKGADVEVSLDNENLVKYSDLKDSQEGSLKISGRTLTQIVVENTNVDDFLKKQALSRRVVLAIIAGRAEYEEDQDLWQSYAGSLLSSLKCQ